MASWIVWLFNNKRSISISSYCAWNDSSDWSENYIELIMIRNLFKCWRYIAEMISLI